MNMITVRIASHDDLRFILQQQKEESNALGFVPNHRISWEISRGRILVAMHDQDKLGYAYLGSARSATLPIYQCVVEHGVRRRTIGEALIESARTYAVERGCKELKCRCREDLEANAFWLMLGFERVKTEPGGTARNRQVHTYLSNLLKVQHLSSHHHPLYAPGVSVAQLVL